VTKILAVFEAPSYSDDDTEATTKVVSLMNEVRVPLSFWEHALTCEQMQTHGSPPAELMGPMPAGLEVGPDGLPKLPDGCTLM
jgi:peroxin-19